MPILPDALRRQAWIEDAQDDLRAAVTGPGGNRNLRRWGAGWVGGLALGAICLLITLPGIWQTWPIDRDEPRFAQASRQMFEATAGEGGDDARAAGGIVVPMIGETPRLNKPPLIYWLHGLSLRLTGGDPVGEVFRAASGGGGDAAPVLPNSVWRYRIVSVACATIAVLLTWQIGLRLFDPRAAWLGALLLAVSPLITWDAHVARADQLLLACTLGAMLGLLMVWRRGRPGRRGFGRVASWAVPVAMWLAVALGVLAKGPITPMVVGLTAIALSVASRRWRWLLGMRPATGLVVLLATTAWWPIAVWMWGREHASLLTGTPAADTGAHWLGESIGRLFTPSDGHWGPPGYHLVLLAVLFWPGSFLTALGVWRAWGRAFRERPSGELTFDGDDTVDEDRQPANRWEAAVRWCRDRWRDWSDRVAGRTGELFCLAWVLPSWIVFELSVTKLPHYVMPLYPGLALLSARAVWSAASGRLPGLEMRSAGYGLLAWHVVGWVWAGAFLVGAFYFGRELLLLPFLGPVVGIGLVYLITRLVREAWWRLDRGQWVPAQLYAVGAAALLTVSLWTLVVPGVGRSLSPAAAQRVLELTAQGRGPFASVGYHEDSLLFLTDAGVDRIDASEAAAWAAAHPSGVLLVSASSGLIDLRTDLGGNFELGARIGPALNYSRGSFETIAVIDAGEWTRWRRDVGGLVAP